MTQVIRARTHVVSGGVAVVGHLAEAVVGQGGFRILQQIGFLKHRVRLERLQ